jgi:type III secretion system low calcium response chaperone LcrH/SycD
VKNLEEFVAKTLGHDFEKLKEAVPEFTKEHIEGLYTLAYDFYESGKYKEAANFFRFLTVLDHAGKKHWIGLAASQQMQKEYGNAVNNYAVAALLDQTDPYTPFYAAECCFSMGDVERGLEALESAETLAGSEDEFKGLRKKLSLLREAWAKPPS